MSNEKAQRQLHRLTRRATQLLRVPATVTLAAAAKAMGFSDLQQQQEQAEEEQQAAAAGGQPPGKKLRLGKNAAAAAVAAAEAAAEAERALAEPETAAAVLTAATSSAMQQLGSLPAWEPAATGLSILAGSKYAGQLPRLTRRFAEVAAAAVAAEAAAAGASAADELAGQAAERALALRLDVAKGAKARKKKALTGEPFFRLHVWVLHHYTGTCH